eukprot:TRINITY_DN48348_c0_g1_i1.p1 TRINITY_DN48348_c0_g1~~TRINITY_DN48348_c0_g1_i1.p1  ORF type:complete len:311 (-),score=36.90 TRINITY_DN48348_c0_g1_i1:52-984(-)
MRCLTKRSRGTASRNPQRNVVKAGIVGLCLVSRVPLAPSLRTFTDTLVVRGGTSFSQQSKPCIYSPLTSGPRSSTPLHRKVSLGDAPEVRASGNSSRETAAVLCMYERLNVLDALGAANCFTENVVYEDMMFGDSSVRTSREKFVELMASQPIFVGSLICKSLDLPPLTIEIDSISEDHVRHTVSVAWHVEAGGKPLLLGRGISFMEICPETGLIRKARDIAEMPWRGLGWLLAPSMLRLRNLKYQDLLGDLAISCLIAIVLGTIIFLDRDMIQGIRRGVDDVDDLSKSLDLMRAAILQRAVTGIQELVS